MKQISEEINKVVAFITTCITICIIYHNMYRIANRRAEDTILLKELELLMACMNPEEETILAAEENENEINLDIPEPKTQSDIDRMKPPKKKMHKDLTMLQLLK